MSQSEHFGFFTYDDWARGAVKSHRHALEPFAISAGGAGKIRIEPGIVEQRGVTVVGHDWIPILADGRATVDRMVHTPDIYIDKMRNIVRDGEAFRLNVQRTTVCPRDAVLIGGSRNYYHWFINHVPRLLWVRELGLLGSRVVLLNDRLTKFQRETLELLQIPPAQWMEIGDDEGVLCPNLLVPTFLARTTVTHPAVPSLLKRALPPSILSSGRRIYISRRDASSRRLVNESAVERSLIAHGFEIVRLGEISLREQIDLFSGAQIVVGVHGAGLTNVLFCPKGARVVEIYTPLHKVSSMRILSALCGHQHSMVPAENVSFGQDGNPLLGDWHVDEARLEAAVLEALEPQVIER